MSITDYTRTPRLPLGGTALRDLGHALTEARPMGFEYGDLTQLIANGERHGVDPRAIAIARERLTAAADRGNAIAVAHLAQLTVREASS